jgi:4-amino-4-deoxy-L-arabinose transferase-like glycosyltransferase
VTPDEFSGQVPKTATKVVTRIEHPARAAFVGAVVAALITVPGLGVGTLWDNSETAYGEVAREILLTHDWVVMHLNGAPWFVQPPLYFWAAALCAMLFGVTSFALRLPAALATILMAAMTGYAVSRQAGTRVGIYTSVVLSSCMMQAIIGRLAIMDALLDLAVALTIFWWFRALEAGRDRYFVYGWIAAAFGFLAKGPIAPVAALLVLVPYAWWNARNETMRFPSARAWLAGLGAAALIVAPWLAAIAVHSGLPALVELIGHYTVGRYTGVIENQAGPLWYYLPVVILGFFPWISFLPMASVYGVRALRSESIRPNIARLLRLAFMWAIVPFVFFSFAKTKLPNYIALEFPALALLVALYLDDVVRKGTSRSVIVSAATVPIFIGLCAFAIMLFVRDNHLTSYAVAVKPDLIEMGASIFVGSLVTAILLSEATTMGFAPYALGVTMMIAVDILALVALSHTEPFKPVPQLAAVIRRDRRPGDAVAIQNFHGGNSLIFYTRPPVYGLTPPGATPAEGSVSPRSIICTYPRVWIVAPANGSSGDPTYGRDRKTVAHADGADLYLIDGPACRSSG